MTQVINSVMHAFLNFLTRIVIEVEKWENT